MKENKSAAHRIIVALDVDTRQQALSLVEGLPEGQVFKIGLRLFTAEGPSLLQDVAQRGKKVFLDLKLHDIPNTVAGAVAMAARQGVAMMTLHASGGREMMLRAAEAAVEEAEASGVGRPLLLGVTVLTSLKDAELGEIGMPADAAGQVLRLAHLAQDAGMDGIDQKRIMTPAAALAGGADYLVIGRPIIAAPSPGEAFENQAGARWR
jgi:orotidine-5'-phosphate decarboxylase